MKHLTHDQLWELAAAPTPAEPHLDTCLTCLSALDGRVLWTDAFKGKGSGGVSIGVPGNVAQADVDR